MIECTQKFSMLNEYFCLINFNFNIFSPFSSPMQFSFSTEILNCTSGCKKLLLKLATTVIFHSITRVLKSRDYAQLQTNDFSQKMEERYNLSLVISITCEFLDIVRILCNDLMARFNIFHEIFYQLCVSAIMIMERIKLMGLSLNLEQISYYISEIGKGNQKN